jgi:hypothetical protein
MSGKIDFMSFLNKWKINDLFIPVSKKLSGKWFLYEFYTEPGNELIHFDENKIKSQQLYWEIEFTADHLYTQSSNLQIPVLQHLSAGGWSRSGNFVTLTDPEEFRNNVEFQFAVEREFLKLLKKDNRGRIEFFGFFRKTASPGR